MRLRKISLLLVIIISAILWNKSVASPVVHSYVDSTLEKCFLSSEFRQAEHMIVNRLKKSFAEMNNDQKLYYYSSLSLSLFRLNEFDSAKIYAVKSMNLIPASRDSLLISKAWKVTAYAYNRCGQLDSALIFTNKLLAYSRRANDMPQYRSALSSLGTILMQNNRPQEALKYFLEVNQVNMRIKDSTFFTSGWYNIGLTYLELHRPDSSLFWLQKAAQIAERQGQLHLLMTIYGSISDCYLAKGDKRNGKIFLIMCNEIAYKVGDFLCVAMGYASLMENAIKDKDFSSALKYGLKADSLLSRNPFPALGIRVDSMMSIVYKENGSPADALIWLTSFVKKKEAFISERQTSLLNKMMIDFGIREKNLIINEQQKEIYHKKIQLWLVISLLFLIVIFLSFLINYLLKTKRFRENLYQKEKYLDSQIAMMMHRYGIMKGEEHLPTNNGGGGLGLQQENDTAIITDDEDSNSTEEASEDDIPSEIPHNTLYLRFLEILEVNKLYLNPDLNIQILIKTLGTNKKYLYQAITLHSKDNFRGIVNRYRVDEAKKIIEKRIFSSSRIEMFEICVNAGFNSTVSFYRSFKMYTGLTPKEYENEAKKEFRKQKSAN